MVDEAAGPGVWEVEHVLDADSGGDSSVAEAQTLSIEVRDLYFVAWGVTACSCQAHLGSEIVVGFQRATQVFVFQ